MARRGHRAARQPSPSVELGFQCAALAGVLAIDDAKPIPAEERRFADLLLCYNKYQPRVGLEALALLREKLHEARS
jgi:hypothetical protein